MVDFRAPAGAPQVGLVQPVVALQSAAVEAQVVEQKRPVGPPALEAPQEPEVAMRQAGPRATAPLYQR